MERDLTWEFLGFMVIFCTVAAALLLVQLGFRTDAFVHFYGSHLAWFPGGINVLKWLLLIGIFVIGAGIPPILMLRESRETGGLPTLTQIGFYIGVPTLWLLTAGLWFNWW